MGVTKCKQTNENIIRMAKAAFPDKGIPQIEELTEGMCNAAYRLTYEDGFKTILKIASPIKSGFMSNEVNLMEAEVKAMRLLSDQEEIKVAKVYAYDTSKTLCEGDYFFMECMEGDNWITVYDKLAEGINNTLRKEVGQMQRELTKITNNKFGLLGDSEHQFDSLFKFTHFLLSNVLEDGRRRNIEIGVPIGEILNAFQKDKPYFDLIKEATLTHWDMWEGNVFVKEGKITGIIDWERAMWGESLMDEPFRLHKRNDILLEGYGVQRLTEEELRRVYWYDVILFLTMMIEVFYREYEEQGQYHWAKGLFMEAWKLITKN